MACFFTSEALEIGRILESGAAVTLIPRENAGLLAHLLAAETR